MLELLSREAADVEMTLLRQGASIAANSMPNGRRVFLYWIFGLIAPLAGVLWLLAVKFLRAAALLNPHATRWNPCCIGIAGVGRAERLTRA